MPKPTLLRWLPFVVVAACASAPLQAPAAEQMLATAEAQIAAGQFAAARQALSPLAGDACPKRLRDRRDFAEARTRFGEGEAWSAYLAVERFADDHPHSDLRPAVVDLIWQVGATLSKSDAGFLFFWSDQRAARTVLEHLITRYPETAQLADALRLLGDMAFADTDYELAQQRYRDLMLDRPESEWVGYAQYKYAMCLVQSLEGPDYDLERMQQATRELRDFLATKPENPEFVRTAQESIQRITDWRLQRHLDTAAFYATVGSTAGRLHHLEQAADPQLAAAAGYAEAVALRDRVASEARQATAPGSQP
ncbi:MAG: outer membrane protein assembly factor BamD [Planctomycetes bacterium]|nr:outer membrane protein assembly factor BamD [Planctomycetota bacterium]